MQARIEAFAVKSNRGKLTDGEKAEYKSYVDLIDLISIFQAKPQQVLNANR